MDFSIITEYIPLYEQAFLLTIAIGWLGIVLAVLIGVLTAFILHFRVPVFQTVAKGYVELFRNTPLLVQLFFIYFGLPKIGISVSAKLCGILGLGLLGGSYMAESIRSGLDAIPASQTESGMALGMTKTQLFGLVILPQAISISVPGILANVIFLLKETSVFSAISLMDLMFTAKDLIGVYAKTSESLFLLVICYLLILLPISLTGSGIERRLGRHGFGS